MSGARYPRGASNRPPRGGRRRNRVFHARSLFESSLVSPAAASGPRVVVKPCRSDHFPSHPRMLRRFALGVTVQLRVQKGEPLYPPPLQQLIGGGGEGPEMRGRHMRIEGRRVLIDLVERDAVGRGGIDEHIEAPAAGLALQREPRILEDERMEALDCRSLYGELNVDDEGGHRPSPPSIAAPGPRPPSDDPPWRWRPPRDRAPPRPRRRADGLRPPPSPPPARAATS